MCFTVVSRLKMSNSQGIYWIFQETKISQNTATFPWPSRPPRPWAWFSIQLVSKPMFRWSSLLRCWSTAMRSRWNAKLRKIGWILKRFSNSSGKQGLQRRVATTIMPTLRWHALRLTDARIAKMERISTDPRFAPLRGFIDINWRATKELGHWGSLLCPIRVWEGFSRCSGKLSRQWFVLYFTLRVYSNLLISLLISSLLTPQIKSIKYG